MDKTERIYIAPKRGRLPRKYRNLYQHRGDRWIAFSLLLGAAFWGVVWWVLK